MAENSRLGDAQRAAWQALCRAWGGSESFQALPSAVVYSRTKDAGSVGWRTHLPTDYLGRDRTLDVLLTSQFPAEPPQYWIEPNPFLEWPHAESNGRLCLWPEDSKPAGVAPSVWIEKSIERFHRLFSFAAASSDAQSRAEEFAAEWTSYWHDPRNPGIQSPELLVLLPAPPSKPLQLVSRLIHAPHFDSHGPTRRTKPIVVCHLDSDRLNTWVQHSGLAFTETEDARVLWVPLRSGPSAPGAPVTLDSARSFIASWAAHREIALSQFEQLLANASTAARWLAFGHGDSTLVGLQLTPTYAPAKFRGHQNPKTREHARKHRQRQGFRVEVADIQRADPPWLQERNRNPRHRCLLQSHIVIVGIGSLGGMVTEGLAMAGVARLTLVDPAILESANVGRHTLGIASIGQNKAFALRSRLLADYPHLEIAAIDKAIQLVPQCLERAGGDLIISTSANPACEAYLMQSLQRGVLRSLMLAWSEPHALAGHSAHSPGQPFTLQSLFCEGRCMEPATHWSQSQSLPLPGCGASHLPGAGNRIRLISALVVEHAIDVVAGEGGVGQHRIWVASGDAVASSGGTRLLPSPAGEATIVRRPVPQEQPQSISGVAI